MTAEDLVEGEKEEGSEEGSVVEKEGEKEEEEEVMEAKGGEVMEVMEVEEMVAALLAAGHNVPSACDDLLCSTKYHLIHDQDFCNNCGYQDPYVDNSLEFYCVCVGIVTSNVGRFFHLQS